MDFKINDDGYIITKAKMASIQPMEYLGEEIGRTSGKVYKVFRDEKEVFSPETIKDVYKRQLKDEDIIPFFAYRTSFIQPKQSSELITKNAVAAFRKQRALEAIRDGKFSFKNIEQLVEFVKTFFRNERLCYGTVYKDFVIIGVDEYGNLINHYQINQAGKPVPVSYTHLADTLYFFVII